MTVPLSFSAAARLPGRPRFKGYQIVANRAAELAPRWPLAPEAPALQGPYTDPRVFGQLPFGDVPFFHHATADLHCSAHAIMVWRAITSSRAASPMRRRNSASSHRSFRYLVKSSAVRALKPVTP